MTHPRRDPNTGGEAPLHWLDQAIETARVRGDFDNLPNTGKRLKLDPVPIDSEWDLSATMMKNAGVSLPWIELANEADSIEAEMSRLREGARNLRTERAGPNEEDSERLVVEAPRRTRWEQLVRRMPGAETQASPTQLPDRPSLDDMRQRYRREHADLAQQLDEKLAAYHRLLPAELWRAQRLRRTAEEWDQRFDAECPPIGPDAGM